MDQKVRFVGEHLKNYFSFSELCLRFEISRSSVAEFDRLGVFCQLTKKDTYCILFIPNEF